MKTINIMNEKQHNTELDINFSEEQVQGGIHTEKIKRSFHSRKEYKKKNKKRIILDGLEATTNPVKLYFKEMGNISLLTRKEEISLAKKIEKGERPS